MQDLLEIVNMLGHQNEQLDIKHQSICLEYDRLINQLQKTCTEKKQLLEDIQTLKMQNRQTIESSVFLTEKNIKDFIRKYLTRLLKISKKGSFGDEFEMCFESLTQSLEYGYNDKQELLKLLYIQ
jgi:hypothetical protein